jgi:LysM repeat protein
MKMNTRLTSLLAILVASAPLLSASEIERLRTLVAEQEMQIQQLELKVAQLTYTPPSVSEPAVAAETPVTTTAVPQSTTPEISPKPASTNHTTTYIVVAGDNMASIARKHGTRSVILNELNGLKSNDIIRPGQKLKVPLPSTPTGQASTPEASVSTEPKAPASNNTKHIVAANETFYSIAKKYNVSINDLIKENPSVEPKTLGVGKIVQIPTKIETTNLAPTPTREPSDDPLAQSHIPVSNQSNPASQPRASDKPVKITKEISYNDFAKSHNTSTTRLDQINGLRLDPSTILAQGSELYVPE